MSMQYGEPSMMIKCDEYYFVCHLSIVPVPPSLNQYGTVQELRSTFSYIKSNNIGLVCESLCGLVNVYVGWMGQTQKQQNKKHDDM